MGIKKMQECFLWKTMRLTTIVITHCRKFYRCCIGRIPNLKISIWPMQKEEFFNGVMDRIDKAD